MVRTRPPARRAVIIRGLASLVLTLGIIIAIPAALWLLGGSPLPSQPPTSAQAWRALLADDGTFFLAVVKLAGWAGWISIVVPLLVQLGADLAGLRPPRLPGLSWQQGRAAALSAAIAALVGLSGATLAHAAADPTTSNTAVATAPATDGKNAAPDLRGTSQRIIITAGDTLWDIAQTHYGTGTAYPRIAEASSGIRQPDGRHLHDPGLIFPGWSVIVPAPTQGPTATTTPPAPTPHSDPPITPDSQPALPTSTPAPTSSSAAVPAPHTQTTPPATTTSPPPAPPTPQASAPTSAPPADNAPAPSSALTAEDIDDSSRPWTTVTVAGLGTLAAAGLLGALAAARHRRGRHRRPGHRPALPTGAAALAESQMRATADTAAVADLDRVLRTLAGNTAAQGLPMPGLRAARITPDTFELYLTEDEATLPRPFQQVPDAAGAWVFDRAHVQVLLSAQEAEAVPAPYPAMVSVGADDGPAHLLVNLEEIGALALSGHPGRAHEVMTALTLELVTSQWADDARITLIGLLPDLAEHLGSDRATYLDPTGIDAFLNALDYQAGIHRAALSQRALTSAVQARVTGAVEETWTPHLVLLGADLPPAQRQRLQELLACTPRLALAAITTTGDPLGQWSLQIADGDPVTASLIAAEAGIELALRPAHVDQDAYQAVLSLFDSVDQPDVPGPVWATTGSAAPSSVHDIPEQHPDLPTEGDPEQEDLDSRAQPLLEPDADVSLGEDAAVGVTADTAAEPDTHPATGACTGQGRDPDLDPDPDPAGPDLPSDGTDDSTPADPLTDAHDLSAPVVLAGGEPILMGEQDWESIPQIPLPPRPGGPTSDPTVDPLEALEDEATTTAAGQERALLPRLPEAGPIVRLLGDVHIQDPPGPEPQSLMRSVEIIAYLALHPGCTAAAFSAAIFPGERPAGGKLGKKRNTYLGSARRWLGTNSADRPYVGLVPAIGYAMDESTPVDWWVFQELIGEDLSAAPALHLEAALRLVYGIPLSLPMPEYDRQRGRAGWSDSDQADMIAAVTAVAHELSSRALRAGDSRLAYWAATKGLTADGASEALWRDRLLAAHQSGSTERVNTTLSRMQGVLDTLGGDLEPATIRVIGEVVRPPIHA